MCSLSYPLVSVIIPCRNEEKFIGKCLDSIISQDYPLARIEILPVDGMSTDGTINILEHYSSRHHFIECLKNTKKLCLQGLIWASRLAREKL